MHEVAGAVLTLDSGVSVARAALWALPSEPIPRDIVLIDAEWSDPDLADARARLARLDVLAAALGEKELRHHGDHPPGAPQDQGNESARLLADADTSYS